MNISKEQIESWASQLDAGMLLSEKNHDLVTSKLIGQVRAELLGLLAQAKIEAA